MECYHCVRRCFRSVGVLVTVRVCAFRLAAESPPHRCIGVSWRLWKAACVCLCGTGIGCVSESNVNMRTDQSAVTCTSTYRLHSIAFTHICYIHSVHFSYLLLLFVCHFWKHDNNTDFCVIDQRNVSPCLSFSLFWPRASSEWICNTNRWQTGEIAHRLKSEISSSQLHLHPPRMCCASASPLSGKHESKTLGTNDWKLCWHWFRLLYFCEHEPEQWKW